MNNQSIFHKSLACVMSLVVLAGTTIMPALAGQQALAESGTKIEVKAEQKESPPRKIPSKILTECSAKPKSAIERASEAKAIAPQVKIPSDPSDLALTSLRLFPEPLIPMSGPVKVDENRALAAALTQYQKGDDAENLRPLTDFIAQNSGSRWIASLDLNLGLKRFQSGYLSQSLAFWKSAWDLSKKERKQPQAAVAERAISELLQLDSRLGRLSDIKQYLPEFTNRPMHGSSEARRNAVQQGVWAMEHSPQTAFRCGPFAVNALLCLKKGKSGIDPRIKKYASTKSGTNLEQVEELAKTVGLDYQMAKRSPNASFIVPSVMHWKVGHFAAIVGKSGSRFVVKDATFDTAATLSASTTALDSESDGYFLVPSGPLPNGWSSVSTEEAKTVWGKGAANGRFYCNTQWGPPPTCGSANCCGSGGGSGGGGPAAMAQARAWTAEATLNIVDTPLSYAPMIGPKMDFRVNYTQNEANQPSTFTYSNLTADWSLNWISKLSLDGSNDATILVRGGGSETYANSGGSTPTYSHDLISNCLLVYVSSGVFQRQLPDGSIELFNLSDGAGNIYLTQVIDPQGNAATINYDTTHFRVTSVTDANGHSTTFSYVSNTYGASGYYLIAGLADAFGRTASFLYDSTNSYLLSITDAAGNVSQFSYQPGTSFIKRLITPYGMSSFISYIPPNNVTGALPQGLRFIYPDGSTSVIENWLGETKETYYWDREATSLYPDDPGNQIYTHCVTTRWLWQSSSADQVPVKNFVKKPLEAKTTYTYTGEEQQDIIGTTSYPIEIQKTVTGQWMENALIAGTVNAGDVLSIEVFDAALPYGAETVSYTVKSGDTLASIAANSALAINNDQQLQIQGITATVTGTTLHFSSISQNQFTFNETATGNRLTVAFTTNSNNLETASLSGTVTAGDTITLTVHDSALSSGQESVTVTAVTGDTFGKIAGRLVKAINADSNLQNLPATASAVGDSLTIQSFSANSTTYTESASSGATEVVTLSTAASNIAIQATQYQYNVWGNVTQMIDAIGRTYNYTFASNGIDQTQSTAVTSSGTAYLGQWTYNNQHEPLTYKDGSAQSTTYGYNFFGQRTSTVDAKGDTFSSVYTGTITATIGGTVSVGNIVTITIIDSGLSGGQTPISYTVKTGDTLSTIASGLATNLNANSSLASLGITASSSGVILTIKSTSPNGTSYSESVTGTASIALSHTDNGYLTYSFGPLAGDADVTTFNYNPTGTLASTTDSEGLTLSFTYDSLNRLLTTAHPDGTTDQNEYQYLDLILSTDRIGRTTQFSYDSLDQLSYQIDPLGRKIQYSWCFCGNLSSITDPLGQTTEWSHDLEGRKITKTYQDSTSEQYSYEAASGRLHSKTDPNGQMTLIVYNVDDTIQSKYYSNATNPTSNVNYTWDPHFIRLTQGQNGWGTYTYSYNPYATSPTSPVLGGGLLASVSNSVIANSTITYSYDSIGRTTNRSINGSSNSDTWTFDAMSRVTAESNVLGSFSYAYVDDTAGSSKGTTRLASVNYPNGQVTNYSYYGNVGDQRLQQINNLSASASVLSQFNYGYDSSGQITSWMQQQSVGSPVLYELGYDQAGQLVGSAGRLGGYPANSASQQYFSYDQASNRSALQQLSIEPVKITTTSAPTAGNVLTINVINSALAGGQVSVNYTVQSGDTTSTIAAQLAAAITANANLQAIAVNAYASGPSIFIRSLSSGITNYSESVSGGATVAIALGVSSNVVENVTVGGTTSHSDILTVTVHDAALTGGTQSVNYTVATGDTTISIATGLSAAINANSSLSAIGVTAASRGSIFSITSNSVNTTNYTSSLSTGATESIALSASLNGIQRSAITGTVNAGDVISLTVKDAGLTGSSESVNYTVVSSDTLATIASNLAAIVNADANLKAIGVTATTTGTIITLNSISVNVSSYLYSRSAGAKEIVLAGLPNNGTQTLAIGGSATTGNVLTLSVYDAGLTGGKESVSYTVASGNTLTNIASGLVSAINADTHLATVGVTATNQAGVINITSASINATTYATALSGGATESMTLGATCELQQGSYNNINELIYSSSGGPARFQGTTSKAMKSVSVASPVVSIEAPQPIPTTYSTTTTGTLNMWLDITQASNGAASATVNGSSVVAGAVVSVTVLNANLSGGQEAEFYTVLNSDTFSTIAAALTSKINADSKLSAIGVKATSSGAVISLSVSSPTYSTSTNSGATETLSLGYNNLGSTAVSIGGSPTSGDVLTLKTTDAYLSGGTASVSYTVLSTDTLATIAAGLSASINSSTALSELEISSTSADSAALIQQTFHAVQPLSVGNNSVIVSAVDGNNTNVSNTNQIKIVGPSNANLTFDLNGNMTSDGTNSYQWDAENRLLQITYPGTGNFSQFTYDFCDRNVKISETSGGSLSGVKQFVCAQNAKAETRDGSGSITEQFFTFGQTVSGTNYFVVKDHLNSSREFLNSSGIVQGEISYDSFGRTQKIQGTSFPDFQYAGYYAHTPSALNLTNYRAYNPSSGRWLSRDWIERRANFNAYDYVENSPSNLVDPEGLAPALPWVPPTNLPAILWDIFMVGETMWFWNQMSSGGGGGGGSSHWQGGQFDCNPPHSPCHPELMQFSSRSQCANYCDKHCPSDGTLSGTLMNAACKMRCILGGGDKQPPPKNP